MQTNVKSPGPTLATHEGAQARRVSDTATLRRTLMACLLWESTFYEDGEGTADRLARLTRAVPVADACALAVEARTAMHLRHAPIWMVVALLEGTAAQRRAAATLIPQIVLRADELTELLALYWKNGRRPLAAALKRGLAQAFGAFSAYSLAKYNRDGAIKLRDVLFLTHAKPATKEQAATWKALVEGTLAPPDTWEVELSKGGDKTAAWTRLLTEKRLGGLALLRNLRNMQEAGIPSPLIAEALASADFARVLPFRFVAAARVAPQWEPLLEAAMLRALAEAPRLTGRTVLVVDRSGSMSDRLSAKSDMSRLDAAAALAILLREVCDDVAVLAYNTTVVQIPARRGFALRDALGSPNGCTDTLRAKGAADTLVYDRCIILTDEQSSTELSAPLSGTRGYVVNVGTYQNGIGYGPWTHIDGWSEAVVTYIQTAELSDAR